MRKQRKIKEKKNLEYLLITLENPSETREVRTLALEKERAIFRVSKQTKLNALLQKDSKFLRLKIWKPFSLSAAAKYFRLALSLSLVFSP